MHQSARELLVHRAGLVDHQDHPGALTDRALGQEHLVHLPLAQIECGGFTSDSRSSPGADRGCGSEDARAATGAGGERTGGAVPTGGVLLGCSSSTLTPCSRTSAARPSLQPAEKPAHLPCVGPAVHLHQYCSAFGRQPGRRSPERCRPVRDGHRQTRHCGQDPGMPLIHRNGDRDGLDLRRDLATAILSRSPPTSRTAPSGEVGLVEEHEIVIGSHPGAQRSAANAIRSTTPCSAPVTAISMRAVVRFALAPRESSVMPPI